MNRLHKVLLTALAGGAGDTTAPTLAITLSDYAFKIGDTATVTFTFSEAPTGFAEVDVTAPNGSLSSFGVTGNPLIYTATFTPDADVSDATNVITVGTSWTDAAGNPPAGATTSDNYAVDTTAPTCVITCDKTSPTGESPMTFTATFSEDVTGFVIGDFGIANGTKGTFTAVSGSVYTLAVTPDAFGDVTATVAAGVCTDAGGNANEEATPLVIFYGVFDPAGMGDGALPSPWTGATWAIASEVVVDTPTESAEILTDGGLENWTTSTNLTSWTEQLAGTSTVNQDTDAGDIHGGSSAARLDVDASNSIVNINQGKTGVFALGDWVIFRAWMKAGTNGKTATIFASDQTTGVGAKTLTTSYAQYKTAIRIRTLSGNTCTFYAQRSSAASDSLFFDDLSVKELTVPTLMATVNPGVATVTVKGAWTIGVGGIAGVIMNLDSVSSPANFLLLYHTGASGTLSLIKCVNGVYSDVLVNQVATYSANANIELRKTAATTYQLWYNGVQIGADQTVNEATINNNTIHGVFSTDGGNSLNRFFVG